MVVMCVCALCTLRLCGRVRGDPRVIPGQCILYVYVTSLSVMCLIAIKLCIHNMVINLDSCVMFLTSDRPMTSKSMGKLQRMCLRETVKCAPATPE